MSGLACGICHRFFRVKKVGVYFEEGMPLGKQHDGEPVTWTSYKLWAADLLECPGCKTTAVMTGPMQRPIAEHYEQGYAELRERLAPVFRVDDCGGLKP